MRFQGEYNEAEFVQFLTKAAHIEYMADAPAAAPPPVYQPAAAAPPPPHSNPASYPTYPQTYAHQQHQQQTYYPPPSHFPARPQSPYQQSYYNTPHYRPPMPEQRLPRQQNFEIADARSGGVFQSVENCSGKKFCYLTLSSAYSSGSK